MHHALQPAEAAIAQFEHCTGGNILGIGAARTHDLQRCRFEIAGTEPADPNALLAPPVGIEPERPQQALLGARWLVQ